MNYASQGLQAGSVGHQTGQRDMPPPMPAPVHAAQAQLVSEIDALHGVISDLHDRLGSVLAPPSPSKEGANKIAAADVTVAQKIDSAARAVRAATDRLVEIRSRLEI